MVPATACVIVLITSLSIGFFSEERRERRVSEEQPKFLQKVRLR
jgi:hypothetical protein